MDKDKEIQILEMLLENQRKAINIQNTCIEQLSRLLSTTIAREN
jgi:hypothetical protein